jgi:hypothetical protein
MAESTRHRLAFDEYFGMGPDRSIARLRTRLLERNKKAPSLRTLLGWSSRYQWQARLARLEHDARIAADQARLVQLKEMYDRQALEGIVLQQKGMEILNAADPQKSTAEVGVRAIVEGAKLERMARGEPGDRSEVINDEDARWEHLSDEQLAALIEHAQRLVEGEGTEKSE